MSHVRRDTTIVENDITTNGEKHRETAEYKRGIEDGKIRMPYIFSIIVRSNIHSF